MKVLFVHQNFPAQFKHLAPALAAAGHEVVALTLRRQAPAALKGVRVVTYAVTRGSSRGIHPWAGDFETKVIRGEACFRAALQLRDKGFSPDVIVAHPGWGESLFLRHVWPKARIGLYGEFFYRSEGADVGFDPETSVVTEAEASRVTLRNAAMLLAMDGADAAIAPTHWQASTYPESFRSRIAVIHDGIDTAAAAPDPGATFALDGRLLSRRDEVITFVSRSLEPYRGYHVFMRALPALLKARPNAEVVIVGQEGVSYGVPREDGTSWKQAMAREIGPALSGSEAARIHHLGQVPYDRFLALLKVSTVHVYLTYPFVLSWSLLEAMSSGCAVVASDTAPVREVITSGTDGQLVDFFDAPGLAQAVAALVADRPRRERFGVAARRRIVRDYDLAEVALPRQIAWVEALSGR
ncbi:glycosyltransferase [Phreatobacter sp.]|uniref:glycosyltransferase n=1 Tax=Phreatobacter sp. TaxID=1966341 RepID=UPI0022C35DAF|nr:glycosyltransferase [Phreatobacter sp.]MCZ8313651.1 glycosyltransferase [Phreatobacter sp.]